jgi:alpha-beta hydrolase superfamily lysophospholipase
MAYEMLKAAADARRHMARLSLPLLIMHGAEDKLTDPHGSVQLFDQARSSDKTLKLWPGCRHELYNEPEKYEVIDFALDWLDEHVQRSQDVPAVLHPA